MNTKIPVRKPNQDYRSREFLYLSEVNTKYNLLKSIITLINFIFKL